MSDNSSTVASSRKPTRKAKNNRPSPPRKDFPLYAHPSGRWCCKSKGRFYYFARWGKRVKGKMERLPDDGSTQAFAEYQANYADILAGRPIVVGEEPSQSGELALADLCNQFLTSKVRLVESGERSPRTLVEYRQTTDLLISTFGKRRRVEDLKSRDFASLRSDLAARVGPVRLGNEVTRIRSVFKYAVDNDLLKQAVRFGSEFRKPDRKVLRRHKAASGKKLFTVDELHLMLDFLAGKKVQTHHKSEETGEPVSLQGKSDAQLRAMLLLGINCGFGNTDVAGLQASHLDFDKGIIEFQRQKTATDRRCPLWPETVAALQAAAGVRPEPKSADDSGCVFLTQRGTRFVRVSDKSRTDYVSREFGQLLHALGINGRNGLNFYSLRHTFVTVGLQIGDRSAVKAIMGHAEGDMLSAYDETGPSDERLRVVTAQVRRWLFQPD